MFRPIVAAIAVLALTAGAAMAETVRDTAHNFRVTVPKGWTSEVNPNEAISIIMMAPDREQTGANCNVVTEAHAPSKSMTQAQIDADIDAQVTADAWANMFKAIIFIDNVEIVKTGIGQAERSCRPLRRRHLRLGDAGLAAAPGQAQAISGRDPGPALLPHLQRDAKRLRREGRGFSDGVRIVLADQRHRRVNEPAGVPSLTLYAAANFGGVSRVVTRDTPDLASFGWRDAAGSMSVGGPGLWQVCEGANYAGRCRLVSAALHERVAVGSARRLPSRESGFGVMLQAGGTQGARSSLRRH